MRKMNIVFDVGNVLLRWDAYRAFLPALGERQAVDDFLHRVDFAALNLRADAGETFSALAAQISDPDDRALFLTYPDCYALTITDTIEGTWALMDRLRDAGHPIHAITNWSAETWPIGTATHPRLASSFGVTVVSGREKVLKPEPAIYHILCDRAGVRPADCVFIDDSPRNVAGARAVGMDAIHFTDPAALEAELVQRGLLSATVA